LIEQALAAPSPVIDVQLEIPTRRPTPVLDIPTSTPVVAESTPTPTPTPTAVLGTPIVIFSARDTALKEGDCTLVSWHVENVRAVYYENMGVDGRGEREVCMDDDREDYNLTVVLPNGGTQTFTATIDFIEPTPTPKPRPTATEVTEPTPTWTPNLPTDTPTPVTTYGVKLELVGAETISCAPGASCETELSLTNTGSGIDSLTVIFSEAGAWPRELCRLDGVCGADRITLANVGSSNTGVVRLRITLPGDVTEGSMVYRLRAYSEGSAGSAVSDVASVEVRVESVE
jgi:hypothetical protein